MIKQSYPFVDQAIFDATVRVAIVVFLVFLMVALLVTANIAFAQKAAPFDLYDFDPGTNTFDYREPGTPAGQDNGAFSQYCVRVVERIPQQIAFEDFQDLEIGRVCGKRTSKEKEPDQTSGLLTFPQQILQLSRCVDRRPLGHASAAPVCDPFQDVIIIGREPAVGR